MRVNPLTAAIMLAAFVIAGCGTSRWAMNDPDYAAKYGRPYEQGEKLPRMAKQSIDARHVGGKGGGYVAAGAADDPVSVGGEIGGFYYPVSTIEGRVALAGLLGTGARDAFVGLNSGLRVHPPTRIAPFGGVGLYGGYSEYEFSVMHDGVDNDGDFQVDEWGETETDYGFLGAVYPEIGVHYWVDGRTRLTGSAAYYVTTEGRNHDFWYFGLGVATLPGP